MGPSGLLLSCHTGEAGVRGTVLQGKEHDVAMGSQGGGCGAGSLALGVLSRLLTCLHLLYEVRHVSWPFAR